MKKPKRSDQIIAATRVHMALVFLKQCALVTGDDRIRRAIEVRLMEKR